MFRKMQKVILGKMMLDVALQHLDGLGYADLASLQGEGCVTHSRFRTAEVLVQFYRTKASPMDGDSPNRSSPGHQGPQRETSQAGSRSLDR